uniref:uncharacterized protein LOC120339815 n=1 Tax=Styela clava TaxID=7725 RepID=UPI0019396275|nr:uncharacterized protein LOC120339815 [Styela clava]
MSANTENCGVVYKSKCFRAIVYDKRNVTLGVAESLCKNKLANIYDITHLNKLKNYLRTMIPGGRRNMWVRTGMTYENDNLYLTNGTDVSLPSKVWYPGHLSSMASSTNVVLLVDRDPEFEQGIYNFSPNWSYHGAICENEI